MEMGTWNVQITSVMCTAMVQIEDAMCTSTLQRGSTRFGKEPKRKKKEKETKKAAMRRAPAFAGEDEDEAKRV